MRGKALILLYLLLVSCSVSRRSTITPADDTGRSSIDLTGTQSLNITDSGFFISRAAVEITGNGEKQKALFSVKYNVSGEYLISVRSRTGIEAARVFLSRDTLLANDRINRILYYGSPGRLSDKYGIGYFLIPLIFGDYISLDSVSSARQCSEGILRKREIVENDIVDYVIDCRTSKVREAKTGRQGELKLIFRDLKNDGNDVHPQKIEIEDNIRNIRIKISIDNIELPWDGNIDFIPGSNYKKVPVI